MSEVNVQKSAGCNEIKINVKPVPVNPVVLENSYRGIDYNVLKHKPQIEGNELIGNKTAKELLGFDKTDMDATVSVAKGAEEVAHAANEKAQNAVDIANAAKETAEGIDAKATEALTNSNTAVNTANSAKQTAQGVDGKATQALENSATALETANQAKATADSFQGTITTLRNDVDDLGDQVAIIEGKIPAEATTANPLADKKFVTTITNELATDITALDGRVNTLETDNAQNKIDIAKNAGDIAALDADIQKINLIKWVQALPATGETKYLYAVPQDEKTLDGENIVLLFVWNDTDGWATVGVQTTAVDLSEYAKQADLTAEASARKEADQVLKTATAAKYGPDNLTAGAGVNITELPKPGGIDAHTKAVWHFDGDTYMPIPQTSYFQGNLSGDTGVGMVSSQAKFGGKSLQLAGAGAYFGAVVRDWDLFAGDFTLEFWHYITGNLGVTLLGVSTSQTDFDVRNFPFRLSSGSLGSYSNNRLKINEIELNSAVEEPKNQWNNIALTFTKATSQVKLYLNGTFYGETTLSAVPSGACNLTFYEQSNLAQYFDEVRVSDVVRYDGDFTPRETAFYDDADTPTEYEISATASGAGLPLLSVHWSDHLLNRMDMLRADTFSWQDGTVYTAAYNELLTEYNNAASADETDGSISFKRTPKGYKICAADQHDNVAALYESTGAAWYYILDVPNQRFKLPRTKFGFTGLRTGAGNYVAPGVPNITGDFTEGGNAGDVANGAFGIKQAAYRSNSGAAKDGKWVDFNAARSSPVYGASDTVQPPATEMYLYFFVGNFTQSAVEQTAGISAETLNNKADLDGMNAPALMKVPQFWQGADFAKMRSAIMDLDWANAIRTWSSTADSYRTEVMPADGLLAGVLSYNGQIEINGNRYSTGTTDNNWGAGYVPFFVKKGDVVKARFNPKFSVLVPFKNQGNADYNPLGFFQYQGQFSDSDSLPTPKINGWALVGNNQLYYVGTDDTGALVWLAGNTITDLGVTGADYVVESYSDDAGNWWRRYKSGWIEQGGYTTNNANITFLKPFSNDKYTFEVSPVGTFGTQYASHGTTNRTTTGISVSYGGDSIVPPNISWYACGQGA